jgi:hypothetical protein
MNAFTASTDFGVFLIKRTELASAINMLKDVVDYGRPRGTPKLSSVQMEKSGGPVWLSARGMQVAVPIDTTGQIMPLPDGYAEYDLEWLWEQTRVQNKIALLPYASDGYAEYDSDWLLAQTRLQNRIVLLSYTAANLAQEEPGEVIATATAGALRMAIYQTEMVAQKTPSTLGLNNVSINFNQTGITLTAGDHYRMSSASVVGSECTGQQWETVAPIDMQRLARMLLRLPAATVVTVTRHDNSLSFATGVAIYTMPLAEHNYPDYRTLFDQRVPPTVQVTVKDGVNMMQVLRNAGAYSGRKKMSDDYLTLSFQPGALFGMAGFLAVSLDGHQLGELPVQVSGQPVICDVNASYLTHAVRSCTGPISIDIWTDTLQMLRVSSAGCRHIIMLRERK